MTFLGSILWIAVFSYLMVWWAHQVSYNRNIFSAELRDDREYEMLLILFSLGFC